MAFIDRLRNRFRHPLLREVDILDPQPVTELRRQVILSNPFVRRIYQEWYTNLRDVLPKGPGVVLELGSGAGFLNEYIPGLVTSEIFHCPRVKVILDGQQIPFGDKTLRGIVMSDVLHHLPQPRLFFSEAARCVRYGGVLTVLEPWMTRWSVFIYHHLHHEPMDPEAKHWEFPQTGPLSGANISLPWILFQRDRAQFESEYPAWKIESIQLMMPFRYLVSGGVTLRPFMPLWSYPLWSSVEKLLSPWMDSWAMFAQVTLRKVN